MLGIDHSKKEKVFSRHRIWCLSGKHAIFRNLPSSLTSQLQVIWTSTEECCCLFINFIYSTLYSRLAVHSFILTLPLFCLHPFLQDLSPALATATHHWHWKSCNSLYSTIMDLFLGQYITVLSVSTSVNLLFRGFQVFTIFVTHNLHVKIKLIQKMSAMHSDKPM